MFANDESLSIHREKEEYLCDEVEIQVQLCIGTGATVVARRAHSSCCSVCCEKCAPMPVNVAQNISEGKRDKRTKHSNSESGGQRYAVLVYRTDSQD